MGESYAIHSVCADTGDAVVRRGEAFLRLAYPYDRQAQPCEAPEAPVASIGSADRDSSLRLLCQQVNRAVVAVAWAERLGWAPPGDDGNGYATAYSMARGGVMQGLIDGPPEDAGERHRVLSSVRTIEGPPDEVFCAFAENYPEAERNLHLRLPGGDLLRDWRLALAVVLGHLAVNRQWIPCQALLRLLHWRLREARPDGAGDSVWRKAGELTWFALNWVDDEIMLGEAAATLRRQRRAGG